MKKKVLLTSILSIVMCLSLIAGATFALFTSESKVNIAVTSGNVEVVAYVDVDSVEYKSLNIKDWTDATNGYTTFDSQGGSATLTFEDLYIEGVNSNTGNGYGIQSTTGAIKYVNCTINNSFTNEFSGTVEYNGCTFTGTFYIWTYSVKEAKFIGCTFDKEDSRAILVYSHGNVPINVLVKDCTFTAKAHGTTWAGDWVAAVEVDTTNIKDGTNVVIENCTYNDQFSNIVRDKSPATAVPAVITVDGVAFSK